MIRRSITAWLAVVLWIVLIYTTIPFVRQLREAFIARWPAEAIGFGVMLVVLTATVGAIILLRRLQRPRKHVLWLLAVATATLLWTKDLMGQPEEAVHFLEYGVLGLLLYRALSFRVLDTTVFVAAALVGVIVGTVDEIIQWIVPGRYFDFRDIALNGGASVLIQIVIWRMARPSGRPVRLSSFRLPLRLAAVWVLLLVLCISATPSRVPLAAHFLPRLSATHEAICDYGHLHSVDDTTRFRSRLSLEDLASNDDSRAGKVAAILDSSRGSYKEFLLAHPSAEDPFAYEARVHIFTRERNLAKALKSAEGSTAHRDLMTTAFRENLILESFFTATISRSTFAWEPGKRARIEAAQDPHFKFTSRVGAHLITGISEGRLRGLLLGLLAILIVCDLSISRRSRSQPRSE